MVRSPLRLLALALCAALLASACVRRGGPRGAGRREQRQLQQQASIELQCRREGLVLTPLTERVVQVHGCGQLRDYAWAPLGRRGRWAPLQPVVLRAATEMGCPPQQLRVEAPSATVRNAAGCGRSARYDLVCGGIECAWMMTAQGTGWGAVAAVGGAPAVAPPAASAPAEGTEVPPPPGATEPADPALATAPAAAPVVPASAPDDGLVIPEPPAQGSAEALLRAMLDQRRADIHRCAGVGVIPVRASWTETGVVSLALEPPLTGSAAEACVRGAVVPGPVPGGTAGEIVHPVL